MQTITISQLAVTAMTDTATLSDNNPQASANANVEPMMEIISPELNRPTGTQPSTQPVTVAPDPVWNEWARMLYHGSLGPLRIPAKNLIPHDFAPHRYHSEDSVWMMSVEMKRDSQRYLFPVLAELLPNVMNTDTFQQLRDIEVQGNFPASYLTDSRIVAGVIHGHKRLIAATVLADIQEEEGHLYAIILPEGTYKRFKSIIDAWVLMENAGPLKSAVSPMEIIRTAGRHLRTLPAVIQLRGKEFKRKYGEFKTVMAAMLRNPVGKGDSIALRGAREMIKRPHLIRYLEYLGRSSLYVEEWTVNAFRKFSQWDLTLFEAVVGQTYMRFKAMSADCPESVTSKRMYEPSVQHSSALTVTATIPKSICKISDFKERLGSHQLDGVWDYWRLDGENFPEYIDRIQTVVMNPTEPTNNLISPSKPKYLMHHMLPVPSSFHDREFCEMMTKATTAFRRVIAFTEGPDTYHKIFSSVTGGANIRNYLYLWDSPIFVEGLLRSSIAHLNGDLWDTNDILTKNMRNNTQEVFGRMLRYVVMHQAALNADWCCVMKEVAKSQYNLAEKSNSSLDQFLPTPNDIAEQGLCALLYSTSWSTLFLRMGLQNGDEFPRHPTLVFEYLDGTTENAYLAKKVLREAPSITHMEAASNTNKTTGSPKSAASSQKSVNSMNTVKLRTPRRMNREESDGSEIGDAVKVVDKGKAKATSPKKSKWTRRIESSVERDNEEASKESESVAIAKRTDLTIVPTAKEIEADIGKGLDAFQEHLDFNDDGEPGDDRDGDYANNDADDEEEEESVETGKKRKKSSKSSKKSKRQRPSKTKPKSASVVSDSDDSPPIATLQDEKDDNEEIDDDIGNMMQAWNLNQLYGLLMRASSGIRVVDFKPDEYGGWTSTLDPFEVVAIAGLLGRLIADPTIRKAAQDHTFPYFATEVIREYATDFMKQKSAKEQKEVDRLYNLAWTTLTHNQEHPTSSQSIKESSKVMSDNWDEAMESAERRKIWSDPTNSCSWENWLNVKEKEASHASEDIDELKADVASKGGDLDFRQPKTSMMEIYDDYNPEMETGSATDDEMEVL